MSVPRITARDLKRLGACAEQVEIVAREWPNGAPITVPTVRKAYRLGLEVEWLADTVLEAPALRAYLEATAPAWRAYQEALAPAWRAYQEATAPAWRAYQEATAPAWRAYWEAKAPARRAYQEAKAPALAPLLRDAWRNR